MHEDSSLYHLTLQINARLQPLDRGDIYEDPMGEVLERFDLGIIEGGGTLLEENGEVKYCDVEICLNEGTKEKIDDLLRLIDEIGVPKGSHLIAEDFNYPLGRLEGLALYINVEELSQENYQSYDLSEIVEQTVSLLGRSGRLYSYWDGSEYTALYYYGDSFDEMKEKMKTFLSEFPLLKKWKIERIA